MLRTTEYCLYYMYGCVTSLGGVDTLLLLPVLKVSTVSLFHNDITVKNGDLYLGTLLLSSIGSYGR